MIIKGKAFWAKICGDPVPGFEDDKLEWSMDLGCLDEATIEKLKKKGLKDTYFKTKNDERGIFLHLKRKATKGAYTDDEDVKHPAGEPAKPIEIIDDHGNAWPAGVLIGNGSDVNVAIGLNTVEWKGKKFLKPSIISVQVWEHVPYKAKGFPKKVDAAPVEAGTGDSW